MKKVLNLYAGLGGNRKKWGGVKVTAVEQDESIAAVYKEQNPDDELVIGDAHDFLLNNFGDFDFIWSSTPCQANSRMGRSGRNKKPRYADLSLYQEVIFMRHFFKGKFVVENVIPYYSMLIPPTRILGRHCFWANFEIPVFDIPNHKNFIKTDSPAGVKSLKDWLGIQYVGNIYYKGNHSPGQVLRNCVHPDTGLHVFNAALGHFEKERAQDPVPGILQLEF